MADNDKEKDVRHTPDYPYRLRYVTDEGEPYWFADHPDLYGCMADGETPDQAVEALDSARSAWVAIRIEDGLPMPDPPPFDLPGGTKGEADRLAEIDRMLSEIKELKEQIHQQLVRLQGIADGGEPHA